MFQPWGRAIKAPHEAQWSKRKLTNQLGPRWASGFAPAHSHFIKIPDVVVKALNTFLCAAEQFYVNMYVYKIKDISEIPSQQRLGAYTGQKTIKIF